MTQRMYPVGNYSNGGWTGTSGLFSDLDETTADDSDYVSSPSNPSGELLELSLSDPAEPIKGTSDCFLRIRVRASGGKSGSLTYNLLSGAGDPMVSQGLSLLPSSFAQTDTIHDSNIWSTGELTNARAQFVPSVSGGGSPTTVDVSWFSFEVPNPGPPPAPTGLTGTPVGGGANLTWDSYTNPARTGYYVLQDGVEVARVADASAVSHSVIGLTPGTSYDFEVGFYGPGGDGPTAGPVAVTPLSAEFLRPNSDIGTTGFSWSTRNGGAYYAELSEASPDDLTSYVANNSSSQGDTLEVGLSALSATPNGNPTFRVRQDNGGLSAQNIYELLCNGNTIVALQPPNATPWQTTEYTLSAAQTSSITDWSALSVRITINDVAAANYITWIELEVPTASGPATQTLHPTGIASGEIFGAPSVTTGPVSVAPTGVASGEAFGSPSVTAPPPDQNVNPSGIASAEAVGTPDVAPGTVSVAPTGVASAEAFGSVGVTTGSVTVAPSGVPSGEAFGSTNVTPGPVAVVPTGIVSANAFGSPSVSPGPVDVATAGITSAEAFGAPSITTGPVGITPTGIPGGEAFGTPDVALGPVTVRPTGIVSGGQVGTPVVAPGPAIIAPSGITSAEQFGTPDLLGTAQVFPSGIPTAEAFGSAILEPGPVGIDPGGIGSAEAFGTPVIDSGTVNISVTGIASAEMFGTASISTGAVTVAPTGVASAEVFGTPSVTAATAPTQGVSPSGVPSGEAFGSPTVDTGPVAVYPSGIVSAEAFGSPNVQPGSISIGGAGAIASGEAFGTPDVSIGAVSVRPSGIPSAEVFGSPEIRPGGVSIVVTGIPTREAFGAASVVPGGSDVAPTGIASAESVGTPAVLVGAVAVAPSGIASGEMFGSPVLQTMAPSGAQFLYRDTDGIEREVRILIDGVWQSGGYRIL